MAYVLGPLRNDELAQASAPFYRRLGATDAGRISSGSIPGRTLPLLHYDIAGPI